MDNTTEATEPDVTIIVWIVDKDGNRRPYDPALMVA